MLYVQCSCSDCALQSVKWAGTHLALRFKEQYNAEYDFRKVSGKELVQVFILDIPIFLNHYVIKTNPSSHRGTCFVGTAGISICRLFYFENKEVSRAFQADRSSGTLQGADPIVNPIYHKSYIRFFATDKCVFLFFSLGSSKFSAFTFAPKRWAAEHSSRSSTTLNRR